MVKSNLNPNAVSSESQKVQIINYLMTKGPLTVLDAMRYIKCYALSQRIGYLKKDGFPIKKEMIQVDSGKRIAKYYL
jgi:hypothetical protein